MTAGRKGRGRCLVSEGFSGFGTSGASSIASVIAKPTFQPS